MAEDNKIGFKGLGSYGNNNKSIVKPKDELNSGTSTSYSKVMSSGKSSSDPFHGLNEPLAKRVQAFNDRRQMRRDARTERLVGGGDGIKSQFTPTAEKGSKLYEKNLKLQNKLNKKFPQPVSTGGSTVTNSNINNTSTSVISNISGATSIKTPATINKPTVQAKVIDAYKKSPPASSGSYTLSSTKDKPISGAEYYTAHALNSEDENFNTIAKQVGNKDELSSNFARALDIKDKKKKDEAIGQAQEEDEAIFKLLFPDY